ncbi:hypothetical protein NLU13_3804 [Sarocladium strictum]|uniref:Transmembrane protein n=1 Tax=Sarocladium strictum TaxID=5046 RepID=A0AA39L824_SARSR|nr:hypothetical protein NLU13_3804 [Sarocladium strictum]
MMVFFVDWELWQEMTFVLACCIVAVFVVGLLRLWLTTRTVRRLEIIDEEKRARASEMRHCGIDIWRADDIPFGVRALQTGVEVDGIWISHPYQSESSQAPSSATLMGGDIEERKERSKASHSENLPTDLKLRHTPEHLTFDSPLHAEQSSLKLASSVRLARNNAEVTSHTCGGPNTNRSGIHGDVWLYVPSGWHNQGPSTGETPCAGHMPDRSISAGLSSTEVVEVNPSTVISGTVCPNTATKKTHVKLEAPLHARKVRPVPETSTTNLSSELAEARLPHFQPGPAQLRKKIAPKPDDFR